MKARLLWKKYELNLTVTLVEFKKIMKIVWNHLRSNYDKETSKQMLAESFITGHLVYKCGEYGIMSVRWENEMITYINSVEGKIFINDEIYSHII
uniref:Uncharacterized protein n=1 Tax=Marseillevirus LCMAC101 TaxID=2506602 RepID=A0A481YT91_9VIRU|nr:MAG: hypothetical protein LCMAC101_05900 [Marseillevirus LCMAC101]